MGFRVLGSERLISPLIGARKIGCVFCALPRLIALVIERRRERRIAQGHEEKHAGVL